MMRKGRNNGAKKLTLEAVREIRRLELPANEIARTYGVSTKTVLSVLRRQSWKAA